ncbi:uncharacterized protein LOC122813283 isoform X1 [Protopterus annectens]|uniref:uncharacterized protein LOC122813283 isoform X1 n=1 Tax=Protopterus annectens TaxID=7888 RepID=UPI001CFBC94F|nr:uncharacterized protein LOC122813283 isoform X1 [Protopterus annectens]
MNLRDLSYSVAFFFFVVAFDIMARNHEKQYGKLNRLWLQKQKDDGLITDLHNRPRLSALNSAAEIKKWIPNIKNEIEYYLEQSQLLHYSERKIQEFQVYIEKLRKEYRRYLWKLRQLDPLYKEHPWKPRGYTRKRQTVQTMKAHNESEKVSSMKLIHTPVLSAESREAELSSEGEDYGDRDIKHDQHLKPETMNSAAVYSFCNLDPDVQDQPLSFNHERMPPTYVTLTHATPNTASVGPADKMTEVLLSKLPNLQHFSNRTATESSTIPEVQNKQFSYLKQTGQNILGLECYSSEEEEDAD